MTYRDDHEALHARVQELERDLQRAQQDAAEGKEAQQRAADLQRALAGAQRELEKLRRSSPGPRQRPTLLFAMAALIFAGGVAAVLSSTARRTSGKERAVAAARAQGEADRAKAREDARREEAKMEAAAARAKALEEAARLAAGTALKRTAPSLALKVKYPPGRALWSASLRSAAGVGVKGPCSLVAVLVEKGLDTVELTCGKKVLYSSKDPLNGMSMGSRQLELEGRRLKLHYVDQGMRSGKRSQIAVNTPEKRVEVWRDADPAFRVRLAVPPVSQPLAAPPAEAPER